MVLNRILVDENNDSLRLVNELPIVRIMCSRGGKL